MLVKLWNKEFNSMQMKAVASKDKKGKDLLKKMSSIKDDVKVSLLKMFFN